jgi:hypothetical protein
MFSQDHLRWRALLGGCHLNVLGTHRQAFNAHGCIAAHLLPQLGRRMMDLRRRAMDQVDFGRAHKACNEKIGGLVVQVSG